MLLALLACGARRAPPEPLLAEPVRVTLTEVRLDEAGVHLELAVANATGGVLDVTLECEVTIDGQVAGACPSAVPAAVTAHGDARTRLDLAAATGAAARVTGTVHWRRGPGPVQRTVFDLSSALLAEESE